MAMVAGLARAQTPADVPPVIAPAPQQPQAVRVSGGVMARKLLHKTQPLYPGAAKVQHISGAVVMQAKIGTDGRVLELKVISGPEILRQSALEAVSQWLYEPYMLNGEPVAVETTVTVNFTFAEVPGLKPLPPEGVPPDLEQTAAADDQPVRVSGGVIAGSILTKRQPVFRPEILCQHVFKPYLVNGKTVAVDTTVTVSF
jgi:TonB family protein